MSESGAPAKGSRYSICSTWNLFNAAEKRNILIYIAGIMLYKVGLEAFNGSIVALAINRYDADARRAGAKAYTFERVGMLTGLNQGFQCVGSIIVAPLIKRFPTKAVLSAAVFVFGLVAVILLVVDASTGGKVKPRGWDQSHSRQNANFYDYYGTYQTDGITPVYCVSGVAYGIVELIRRVIPRDIVGGDVQKLRRLDALVHIFYEIAGVAGAFATGLTLIPRLGNNMSFVITPILFTAAAITWWSLSHLNFQKPERKAKEHKPMNSKVILKKNFKPFYLFGRSVWVGGKIMCSSRKFIWLIPGYSLALYGHRYIENGIAPIVAKRYFGNSGWSQIIVGGTNIGEFLGAVFVFLFTNIIKTPIPWLRIDACMLPILWYLSSWWVPMGRVQDAWVVGGSFVPIGFGWAAGDVSIAAYIQALLQRRETEEEGISPLGAVMAFLYCTYIITYAILGTLLGKYVDSVGNRPENHNVANPKSTPYPGYPDNYVNIRPAVFNIAGVQFTVLAIIIMLATLLPQGSFALNPKSLYGDTLESEGGDGPKESEDISKAGEQESVGSIESGVDMKGANVNERSV